MLIASRLSLSSSFSCCRSPMRWFSFAASSSFSSRFSRRLSGQPTAFALEQRRPLPQLEELEVQRLLFLADIVQLPAGQLHAVAVVLGCFALLLQFILHILQAPQELFLVVAGQSTGKAAAPAQWPLAAAPSSVALSPSAANPPRVSSAAAGSARLSSIQSECSSAILVTPPSSFRCSVSSDSPSVFRRPFSSSISARSRASNAPASSPLLTSRARSSSSSCAWAAFWFSSARCALPFSGKPTFFQLLELEIPLHVRNVEHLVLFVQLAQQARLFVSLLAQPQVLVVQPGERTFGTCGCSPECTFRTAPP